MRETQGSSGSAWGLGGANRKGGKTQQEKAKARKENRPKKEDGNEAEENDLPEVDQNTKKSLRQRKN